MHRIWSVGALAIILVAGSRAPVAADDAATLSAKVDGAISGAASYRIAVLGPGVSLDILSVGQDRVRIISTLGGVSSESVVVGTSMYYRGADGVWQSYAVPPLKRVRKNRLYMGAADTPLRPLADRTDSDATWGAFSSQAQGNTQLNGSMECTYDKATYRPRACTIVVLGVSAPLRVTYDRWNDPANTIEAPAGVAPPTPAPAATAAPH